LIRFLEWITVAGGGAIYCIWILASVATPNFAKQALPVSLFSYAQFMLIWAWQGNKKQPFHFAFSPVDPVHFKNSGPCSVVRHPFYSSYIAA
jgi:protein-S-isoprenylcysteine O-methyltransferase Ste14